MGDKVVRTIKISNDVWKRARIIAISDEVQGGAAGYLEALAVDDFKSRDGEVFDQDADEGVI